MRIHEPPSWFSPVSLLTMLVLLSAVPAFADPPDSMHGLPHEDSKDAHAATSLHNHGKSSALPHDGGHHPKDSYQGHGDDSRSSQHDGMHKRHGKGHHPMHSSGYGSHHTKGHDRHGFGSTHPGTHQGATEFITHLLKFKEGMSVTAKQEQQLHALKTTYKKTRIKMKAEVQLASVDLHEVLKDEKASLSDIEVQFNAMHALKTKLYMASIKAKRDAKAVLSPEQRSRMDNIHERMKAHGGNMMHKKNEDDEQ